MEIKQGQILSSVIRVNNDDDAEKVYDISADVTVNVTENSQETGRIRNGYVRKDDSIVANWSRYGQLSVVYSTDDADEQVAILQAVQVFCEDIQTFVGDVNVNVGVENEN